MFIAPLSESFYLLEGGGKQWQKCLRKCVALRLFVAFKTEVYTRQHKIMLISKY